MKALIVGRAFGSAPKIPGGDFSPNKNHNAIRPRQLASGRDRVMTFLSRAGLAGIAL